ncbi:MAG: DNA-3-methyladenine glycosylase 2 family protein [Erysipelotrichaceae bacterium]|nr:DNA-3-methyladenine glycosylase 2 family protein [Erysipelotrichaceae bacterium]
MLGMDSDSLYAAYKSKDPRFDGRFFIGVSSTRIYCRPICRARTAKQKNCTFYLTAAEAEQSGYRPCLLCRPELAPGPSITDANNVLAYKSARMLIENCDSNQTLDELAMRLGCTDRHLQRIFKTEYNVFPMQYLQTCRLLLAKNLLTDTSLPIVDIAMTVGFGSLQRFNDLFKTHYKLSPSLLRKKISKEKNQTKDLILELGYRPPYRFEEILSFLAARAIPGVEVIKDMQYMRTVRLIDSNKNPVYGWIKVGNIPEKNALSVTLSETLLIVLPQVLVRVSRLFDLNCDPEIVHNALSSMKDIRPNISTFGIRLPGCFNTFEMAVRAVLGQQITVKAANTLAGRLVVTFGMQVKTNIQGLTHVFPSPKDFLELDKPIENYLGPLGIIKSRARTIYELSKVMEQGSINFEFCCRPEDEIEKLLKIPGIGKWTANYIAMRTMEWTDAFLETDVGIKKALYPRLAKEMLAIAEQWRPWRSYATIILWNSL